jgi:ribosome-associated translation inhibitor RaiA
MSKKDHVTYANFIKAANELKEEGLQPSVRLVRLKIGGSNSTLLEYLRRWHSDTALSASVDQQISDPLKDALLMEFGRVTQSLREKFQVEVNQERQQNKEVCELLAETESRCVEIEAKAHADREQAAAAILKLEKQLSAANERAAELQRQAEKATQKADKEISELEKKVGQLREEAHQAQIKAAIAETKVAAMGKA